MNFSEQIKKQLCEIKRQNCCEIAAFSAFVRTAGSVIRENGTYGIALSGQNDCLEYFADISERMYNVNPVFSIGSKNKINSFSVVEDKGEQILFDLGIFKIENGELQISFEPEKYLTENQCCKRAYICGAFMGGGSVTLPSTDGKTTGYHLEFVFSKYATARHFGELLVEVGFLPKHIQRKENQVIYFKQADEIKDLLEYMQAEQALKSFKEIVSMRDVKNRTNRENNCFLYNTDKIVNASVKQRAAIELIEQTIGLDAMPEELKKTAKSRLKNPEVSLNELSEILGVSKSCLNHRLRKIVAIAENLK